MRRTAQRQGAAACVQIGARNSRHFAHEAQDLRHLIRCLRSRQQDGANEGNVVVLALLRGILRYEKQVLGERPPEGVRRAAQQAHGGRKIHIAYLEAHGTRYEVAVERHFHAELFGDFLVAALRIAAIVEAVRSLLIVQLHGARELRLRYRASLLGLRRDDFGQTLSQGPVRGIEIRCGEQFCASLVELSGNGVTLGGVRSFLDYAALRQFAVNEIVTVVRGVVHGVRVSGVGGLPILCLLVANTLFVRLFRFLVVGL